MKDRGSATAEVAILLPGVVLLLALVLAAGSGAVAQVRCVDAARTGARLAARGESSAAVMSATRAAAPAHAQIQLTASGDQVRVVVMAPITLPLTGAAGLRVRGAAVADLERAFGPAQRWAAQP